LKASSQLANRRAEQRLTAHEFELHLQRQDERLEAIMSKLFEWCAPRSLKDEITSIGGVGFKETSMPADMTNLLRDWTKRHGR
jgi:hypothetical protein